MDDCSFFSFRYWLDSEWLCTKAAGTASATSRGREYRANFPNGGGGIFARRGGSTGRRYSIDSRVGQRKSSQIVFKKEKGKEDLCKKEEILILFLREDEILR